MWQGVVFVAVIFASSNCALLIFICCLRFSCLLCLSSSLEEMDNGGISLRALAFEACLDFSLGGMPSEVPSACSSRKCVT